MGSGEICPELEAPHQSILLPFGHFLVNNPAAGSHPLDISRRNRPLVPHTVPMLNLAIKHIGNRLDPSMGVPWKTSDIVIGIIRMKIIEEEKGIEQRGVVISEGPL